MAGAAAFSRDRRPKFLVSSLLSLMLACEPEPEPEQIPNLLEAHAERVRVYSNQVDQICGGTLAYLDDEYERIEAALGLPTNPEIVDIWLLSRELVFERCGVNFNCARHGWIAMRSLDAATHELVHSRIGRSDAAHSVPFFNEGIAEAFEPLTCDLQPVAVDVQPMLEASSGPQLRATEGYHYLGHLTRQLLAEHGPALVLELMDALPRGSTADDIRQEYALRFGGSIDEDIFAELPIPGQQTDPIQLGCLAPEAPADLSSRYFQATLDCDSSRVVNDFHADPSAHRYLGRRDVYVEWTMTIDEHEAGEATLIGELPADTHLAFAPCWCESESGHHDPLGVKPQPFNPLVAGHTRLDAGIWRVRWSGTLDQQEAVLDVELELSGL